jgi:hypothetical protein
LGNAFDRCLADETGGGAAATATNVGNCNTFGKVKMSAPPATNFSYTVSNGGTVLTLKAVGTFSGAVAADSITFTYNGVSGATTKVCGAGKFVKMCKT